MENFNYPYISTSIHEFWRHWHISLSTWFREYLYIRWAATGKVRTYINLLIVFFATGSGMALGQPLSSGIVPWAVSGGGTHGDLGSYWRRSFRGLNHIYMGVGCSGWLGVLPRRYAGGCGSDPASDVYLGERHLSASLFVNRKVIFSCGAGRAAFGHRAEYAKLREHLYEKEVTKTVDIVIMAVLLFLCTMYLVSSTYNPFIYFRF